MTTKTTGIRKGWCHQRGRRCSGCCTSAQCVSTAADSFATCGLKQRLLRLVNLRSFSSGLLEYFFKKSVFICSNKFHFLDISFKTTLLTPVVRYYYWLSCRLLPDSRTYWSYRFGTSWRHLNSNPSVWVLTSQHGLGLMSVTTVTTRKTLLRGSAPPTVALEPSLCSRRCEICECVSSTCGFVNLPWGDVWERARMGGWGGFVERRVAEWCVGGRR